MSGERPLNSRYLVTGGAGFVGAALSHTLLARGSEVTILDSGVAAGFDYVEGSGAHLIKGDIRDPQAVQDALVGCTALVHLAAQASVPDSIERPIDDLQVNVDASLALFEAARQRGIRRIVFASSNATVSGHPPPAHEGLTPRPVSPYGAAKSAVETYLCAYHQAYDVEGVALRFSNAYGPWSAHKRSVVAAFVKSYLAGGPLIIRGNGHQTRDFVHVADIVAAVIASLDAPSKTVAGEIFHVGSATETSLLTLAETLFEVGGRRVALEHQPASAGDVARSVSDVTKAARAFGYRPTIDLHTGLSSTLEWFRGR